MIGLLAEIGFTALLGSIEYWDFSRRRTYRHYLRALPAGETPLSKREWKASERDHRRDSSGNP